MGNDFDPYSKWLGIGSSEPRPISYYRLLGITEYEADSVIISMSADRQIDHLKKFSKGLHGDQAEQLINELIKARLTLLKPDKRAAYDKHLNSQSNRSVPAELNQSQELLEPQQVAKPVAAFEAEPDFSQANTHPQPSNQWLSKPKRNPWIAYGILASLLVLVGILTLLLVQQNQDPVAANELPKETIAPQPSLATEPIPAKKQNQKQVEIEQSRPVAQEQLPDNPPDAVPENPSIPAEVPPVAPEVPLANNPAPVEQPVQVANPMELPVEVNQKRHPIPHAEQLAPAKALVNELYAKEILAAKKPSDKAALAVTLLKTGTDTTDDDVARYALISLARELSISGGDVATALSATKTLCNEYELESFDELLMALTNSSNATAATDQIWNAVSTACQEHADDLATQDKYEQAIKLLRLGLEAARKARDPKLTKTLTDRGKELTAQQLEFSALSTAQQKLAVEPDDPAANMVIGRWHWFRKNDRARAMPFLAKTAESPLKTAAVLELTSPTDPLEQVKLADQWWTLSQAVKEESMKRKLSACALEWYEKSHDKLTGLQKTKAEKRIAELRPSIDVKVVTTPPIKKSASIKSSLGSEFVYIHPGTFKMGSPATEVGRTSSESQVDVVISKGFYLGKYEVTQGEWKSVMGSEPWKDNGKLKRYVREGNDYPATYVTWESAVEFCKRLSLKENKEYRLPTEAEWEYACRSGSKTAYSFGDSERELSDYAWWGGLDVKEKDAGEGNAKSEQYAHRIGLKKANSWGLHDMHGNVCEWCADHFEEKLPGGTDPFVPPRGNGVDHMFRGGRWSSPAVRTRSAQRAGNSRAGYNTDFIGFRLVFVSTGQQPLPPQPVKPSPQSKILFETGRYECKYSSGISAVIDLNPNGTFTRVTSKGGETTGRYQLNNGGLYIDGGHQHVEIWKLNDMKEIAIDHWWPASKFKPGFPVETGKAIKK